ncbi:hypothetical protein pEaSNUABM11_00251 [Erwinia phage pEa_SNUABM_11]|nr:hypothetical protein pEaSNUABM11_00251 [Erwinia phage pEa_SNUABM_11]
MSSDVENPAEINVGFNGDINNEDDVLRFTQQVRMLALNQVSLTKDLGSDHKAINSLAKLADGMDKQVLTKKRIATAEKANEISSDVANTLNQWVTGKAGAKIQRHDAPGADTGHRPMIPILPSVIHKEGELAPVGSQVDVEQIMKTAFSQRRPTDEDDD